MKLLKRVSILAVLITVIAVFAGCGKEATVVGTWEGDDYTYTFNDDGTGIQQIGEIDTFAHISAPLSALPFPQ